ncbi:hypothetical protein BOTBODRAFT_30380 [Botryobasidium botryosum FD-172 SS1]|uniref:U6 small nuclear RNA (adenine-(43)-N(6))-methyltransferase n=1 Tax=Botryobasidium botryosum (strain FD-172 SS1) TaxID=930990 RepID=A0A067MZP5_BOTB1|nr:hypothetical protein BOTBODRAFT_30380 [Botryobasidium botryosum FD-172 SS1]
MSCREETRYHSHPLPNRRSRDGQVPNRLNYVLWIKGIIDSTTHRDGGGDQIIRGIDIGTGASAIYPLLGCAVNPNWHFVATDIDDISLLYASTNIKANNLESRIKTRKSDADGPILSPLTSPSRDGADLDQQPFDFTMCNPPFYASKEEIALLAGAKEFDPHAVCTGSTLEMITEGGEVGFVKRMIEESRTVPLRCRWFTSLLGKLSSVVEVVEMLKNIGVDNYGITEFVQGHTRRWGVAWSFGDERLPDNLARISNHALQAAIPPHNNLQQTYGNTISPEGLMDTIRSVLSAHPGMHVEEIPALGQNPSVLASLRVCAWGNTWSRAARRKKRNDDEMQVDTRDGAHGSTPASVECVIEGRRKELGACYLECRWVRGRDRALFESLWSHLSRKVAGAR